MDLIFFQKLLQMMTGDACEEFPCNSPCIIQKHIVNSFKKIDGRYHMKQSRLKFTEDTTCIH